MDDHADLQSRFPYHKSMALNFKYQRKVCHRIESLILCIAPYISYAKMVEYT